MMKVDHRVGRLLEVRISSPVEMTDFPDFTQRLGQLMRPHEKIVFCVDWRGADIFSSEVSERFLTIMKGDNPKIERSAFLLGNKGAVFAMQMERLIWQADNPNRKTFRDVRELTAWLNPSLNAEEKLRLSAFMAEWRAP